MAAWWFPPEQARRWMDRGLQLGPGWSRADVGRASRPARNDLALVAIVNRIERADERQGGSWRQAATRQGLGWARRPAWGRSHRDTWVDPGACRQGRRGGLEFCSGVGD